jgi:hypothetical protein
LEAVEKARKLWKSQGRRTEPLADCFTLNLTVKHTLQYCAVVPGNTGADEGADELPPQEFPPQEFPPQEQPSRDLATGFLVGLLVGEGHFGGDGRQPQVTLRMHVRHERTFQWLTRTYSGSRLYGPYHHGGRSYYQWSARGRYLRDEIVPLIERHRGLLDTYTADRFDSMCDRYRIDRAPAGPPPALSGA